MKVDFRLYFYNLTIRAISELLSVGLSKEQNQTKGLASFKERDSSFTIFDPIKLRQYFQDFISDKNTYLSLLEAVKNIIRDISPNIIRENTLYKATDDYFTDSAEYQKIKPEITSYRGSISSLFESNFLSSLEEQFSYYPYHENTGIKTTNVNDMGWSNENERKLLSESSYTHIMNIRDAIFSVGYYPYTHYLDGRSFSEEEIIGRKIIHKIFSRGYWIQILHYDKQLHSIIDTINLALDKNWSSLMSKYEKGRYHFDWVILHKENWYKELKNFTNDVNLPLIEIPTFLLNIDLNVRYVIPFISKLSSIEDHLCFSLPLKSADKLWIIKNLSSEELDQKKKDFAIDLCSILFFIRVHRNKIIKPEQDLFSGIQIFPNFDIGGFKP